MADRRQNQTASDSRARSEAKRGIEECERPPLPPGHPITWQILIEGTFLEGIAYPLPVFL